MACAGVGIQARLGIGPFVMSGDLGDMRHAQRLLVDALKKEESLKSLALGNAADAKHWKQRADRFEGVLNSIIKGNPRCQNANQILAWMRSLALTAIGPKVKSS